MARQLTMEDFCILEDRLAEAGVAAKLEELRAEAERLWCENLEEMADVVAERFGLQRLGGATIESEIGGCVGIVSPRPDVPTRVCTLFADLDPGGEWHDENIAELLALDS